MYCQCCILQILIFLDGRVGKLRLTNCHKILLAHFLFFFCFPPQKKRRDENTENTQMQCGEEAQKRNHKAYRY